MYEKLCNFFTIFIFSKFRFKIIVKINMELCYIYDNLQPKREQYRKATAVLAPVIDLKSKANRDVDREDDGSSNNPLSTGSIGVGSEFDWNVVNEYDPMWPNEYEKVVKELRDIRDREHDQETELRKRRRDNTRFEDTQVIIKYLYLF